MHPDPGLAKSQLEFDGLTFNGATELRRHDFQEVSGISGVIPLSLDLTTQSVTDFVELWMIAKTGAGALHPFPAGLSPNWVIQGNGYPAQPGGLSRIRSLDDALVDPSVPSAIKDAYEIINDDPDLKIDLFWEQAFIALDLWQGGTLTGADVSCVVLCTHFSLIDSINGPLTAIPAWTEGSPTSKRSYRVMIEGAEAARCYQGRPVPKASDGHPVSTVHQVLRQLLNLPEQSKWATYERQPGSLDWDFATWKAEAETEYEPTYKYTRAHSWIHPTGIPSNNLVKDVFDGNDGVADLRHPGFWKPLP